jgi:hypothetical protein
MCCSKGLGRETASLFNFAEIMVFCGVESERNEGREDGEFSILNGSCGGKAFSEHSADSI